MKMWPRKPRGLIRKRIFYLVRAVKHAFGSAKRPRLATQPRSENEQPIYVPSRTPKTGEIRITMEQAATLAALWGNPAYNVLLDIMEGECQRAETEHFQTDSADEKAVIAMHRECRGMRKFFERVQNTVNYHVGEAQGEVARKQFEARVPTGDEYIEGLLNQ